jgi:hypothetical protein
MNRRRLEAEALWDCVHATAGTINLKMHGRPVVPALAEDEIAAPRTTLLSKPIQRPSGTSC